MYPGITYLGTGKFVGLYGLNETIHDQKAIGLQHLFIDDYLDDFIHTATTVVIHQDIAYYGDRIKPRLGHSLRQASTDSLVDHHCIFSDTFVYPNFSKNDRVTAYGDHTILFQCTITNTTSQPLDFQVSSLVITQTLPGLQCEKRGSTYINTYKEKTFIIVPQKASSLHLSTDAPSGFMYKGIENLLINQNHYTHPMEAITPLAMSQSDYIHLGPHQSNRFEWVILIGHSVNECINLADQWMFEGAMEQSIHFWTNWLAQGQYPLPSPESKTALIALKAINLNGFLPADLTGHYFADHQVPFYSRDALMGSRGFLYSGHFVEFKAIVQRFLSLQVKPNGEYYQRYTPSLEPREGANNKVFSQIDYIGYITRVIADYYALSGELLVSLDRLDTFVEILNHVERKHDLYGPEGGVNEGVYGPAYIVSTNMFIAGGLFGIAALAKNLNALMYYKKWSHLANSLVAAIDKCFLADGYFGYGYVTYHDDLIYRYDTPQLMGSSLGFPLTTNVGKNFDFIMHYGTYFGHGVGYSEQEYHNGPWLFNTAAGATTSYLLGHQQSYQDLLQWMSNHVNAYGILPEAIDARNELHPFINPLMWANAEMICAYFAPVIEQLRRTEYETLST